MDPFIKVYDDVFSPSFINNTENIILNSNTVNWKFSSNISNSPNSTSNNLYGFHHYFFNIDDYSQFNSELAFYFFQIVYKVSFISNLSILKILNARIFLQTPSPEPSTNLSAIHTDLEFPHWVCIYYVNDSKGDTVFFNNQKEEIKRISPKKGRVVLFDGNIKHTGGNPPLLRSLINFNFIGKKV